MSDDANTTDQTAADAPVVEEPKPAPSKRAPKVVMEDAIVKRGTIVYGDNQHAGPGDTVTLPSDEVAQLRAAGVLVDPNDEPMPAYQGPTVSNV